MAWKDLNTFMSTVRQPAIDMLAKGSRARWSTSNYTSIADMMDKLGNAKATQEEWATMFKDGGKKYTSEAQAKLKGKIDLMLATRRDIRCIYGADVPARPRVDLDMYRIAYSGLVASQYRTISVLKDLGV